MENVEKEKVKSYCELAVKDMHDQWTENELNLRYKKIMLEKNPDDKKIIGETIERQEKNKEKLELLIKIAKEIIEEASTEKVEVSVEN